MGLRANFWAVATPVPTVYPIPSQQLRAMIQCKIFNMVESACLQCGKGRMSRLWRRTHQNRLIVLSEKETLVNKKIVPGESRWWQKLHEMEIQNLQNVQNLQNLQYSWYESLIDSCIPYQYSQLGNLRTERECNQPTRTHISTGVWRMEQAVTSTSP